MILALAFTEMSVSRLWEGIILDEYTALNIHGRDLLIAQ